MSRTPPTARSARPAQGDRGQASVELALVLPVILLVALALGQAVLVGRDQLLVVHAARAAAREAAVDPRAGSVRDAALDAAPGLKAGRLQSDITVYSGQTAGLVTVTLHYRSPTAIALIGPLLPDIVVTGKAAFREEGDTQRRHSNTTRDFQQETRHEPLNPASGGPYRLWPE